MHDHHRNMTFDISTVCIVVFVLSGSRVAEVNLDDMFYS